MGIHFDTADLAIAHLQTKGFNQLKNGRWFSKDMRLAAQILTIPGSDVVLLQVWERA